MTNEQMRQREPRPAQLADVRLLPRVDSLMILQLVGLGKFLLAHGAGVGPLLAAVDLVDVLVQPLGHNVLAAVGAGSHLHYAHPVLRLRVFAQL